MTEMIIEIKLQKQVGTRVDRNKVIADSRNYLKVKFDFSEEWIETKTAIFKHKDQKEYYECLIDEENSCYVPQEVIKKGSFYVSAICGDLITSNRVDVDVEESGYMEGAAPPPEPTPDIYSQILKVCEETESIAQSVRDDADAGKFNGEKGEQGEPGTTDYNALENKPDLSVYAIKTFVEEADTELQTQITGLSSSLTTTNAALTGIEETIPTLATKSELPTLTDLAQAGDGIEFKRKVVQGGDNYTITGSPNIDENGIFTASSTGNYISSPSFDTLEGQTLEFEFTTPSAISSTNYIVHVVGNGRTANISVSNSFRVFFGAPVSIQLQTVLSPDTSYVLKFSNSGETNTLTLFSADGTQLEEKSNTNTLDGLSPFTLRIGRGNLPFKFDLNKMTLGDWTARTTSFDGYVINSNCMRLVYFSQNGADFCKVYEFTDPSTGEIKYWTEQQGRITKPDANPVTVTYPLPMADTDYFFSPNQMFDGTGRTQPSFGQMTTTSVVVHQGNGSSVDIYWTVCGLGVKPV